MKKLYKSKNDVVLLGILGGVSEYANMDSTVVRLLFLLLVFVTGFFPGILFYIVAGVIVPEKDSGDRKTVENEVKE